MKCLSSVKRLEKGQECKVLLKMDNEHIESVVASHQPDPTFFGSEYDYYETEDGELTEGEMYVVNTEQRVYYDNSPFLIDLTNDMRKFWRSETDVMVTLQREYPKLDITVSKTWKGQTLIRPLSNDSQFLLYNMRSLRGKPIAFLQMDAWQNFLTAILCKVPHALSEQLLEEVVPELRRQLA